MFFYKNYINSPKATIVNGSIRAIGFFPFLFTIFYGIEESNFVPAIVAFVFYLIMIKISNLFSDNVAKNAAENYATEFSTLLQTKKNDNNEDVLDIPEEVLSVPATIILERLPAFAGMVATAKYTFNDGTVYKLKKDESVEIKTTSPLNTIYMMSLGNKVGVTKFTVKAGETVHICYKFDKLVSFERVK